jgi:glycosyltransferase involved in cell wall biosynthesis
VAAAELRRTQQPSVEGDVSLIIPSRDRLPLLVDTVRSVLAGDVVPAEIVVVDQSPTASREVATLQRVVYVHTQSMGLSRARNIGVLAARHDIIVFLDDDMLVDQGWLAAIVGQLRRRGAGWAVTGQVREGAAERSRAFQMSVVADTTPREYSGRLLRDVLYSGNMAIGRDLLDCVGEFDERLGAGSRFPGAEDNDFGYRLLALGARIAYAPDAAVQHRAWRPPEHYVRMRWGYGLGQGGFYAKHAAVGDRFMVRRTAWHVGYYLRRLPARFTHEPLRARGDMAFLAGMVVGGGRWLLTYSRRAVPPDHGCGRS